MKTDCERGFADFLEERLGKSLFTMMESNAEYRNLSDEFEDLLNSQYQSIDEYKTAISKIADIYGKLNDIEKHYLFLAGMREHANMKDNLLSEHFERQFIGME